MNKGVLRKIFLEKRKMLAKEEHHKRSESICQNVLKAFDWTQFQTIHLFKPILKQNEPNTDLIASALISQFPHLQLIYSRADIQSNQMNHFITDGQTKWIQNKWGIEEPVEAKPIDAKQIDVVFVPLITADKAGHRIGYGKGYYDRFLSEECRKDVLTIGISLAPLIEKLDIFEKYDQKLRYCINHREVIKF